ncbi:MAG: hypothetical protein JST42_25325, partial [Bacteroidetes bacterium]|nr:hypothetical protein [Bacteroidota bacterium]
MKTLIFVFVAAALLALSSCTKDVVVPDNYPYSGYYADPYSDPYYDPYYDPNYDPYYDPNYDPYGNSVKPGVHTGSGNTGT